MADFASQTLEIANNVAKSQNSGLTEAFANGIQLAQKAEQIQLQRQELEMKKQELTNTRVSKFMDDISNVNKYTDPKARKGYLNMMKSRRDMWGLQSMFSDESIDSLSRSDEELGRAVTLAREVNQPGSSFYGRADLAAQAFNDPVMRAKIAPTPPEMFGKDSAESADLNKAMDQYQKNQATAASKGGIQSRFDENMNFKKLDTASKALQKENVTERRQAFKTLDGVIPGGLYGAEAKKVVSGVSGVPAQLPTNWLSDKNSATRQAALGVANAYIKSQAGTNVTEQELNRTLAEIGMAVSPAEGGGWRAVLIGAPQPAQFIRGMRNLDQRLKATESRIKKTYGSEVYNQITEPDESGPQAGNGKTPPPPPTNDWKSKVAAQKSAVLALPKEEKTKYILSLSKKLNIKPAEIEAELGK